MRSFRRLTRTTLLAVYLLILVGGIVRSTGSGMGCPDWPKCFGSWVPPTSVTELPEDYKDKYSQYRQKKNQRFASYLRMVGMGDTAEKLLNDRSVLQEADFNPTKTWIEYINRLVGVIIGLLIFAVFVRSLSFWRSQRNLTVLAFLTLVLVGFQGWLGSFVVSSNLTPWTVSVHMFVALVIVGFLIVLYHASSDQGAGEGFQQGTWWLVACMAVLLVQILLGTRVREAIDGIAAVMVREKWISAITAEFVIHRSFSWIVLFLHGGLLVNLWKTESLKAFSLTLIVLLLLTILTGVSMAYFAIPPFLQPLHLLLATASFGMQVSLFLRLNRKKKPELVVNHVV